MVWQWNKALDPGVFESPNSEIQTQISNEIFFLSNVRVSSVGGKAGVPGPISDAKGLLFIAQASVICTFQNISKFGNVKCMLAWACNRLIK